MHYQSFYRRLENEIRSQLSPLSDESFLKNLDHLISPHQLNLDIKIKERCEEAIKTHWLALQTSRLPQPLQDEYAILKKAPIKLDSPLMAYDFHTTATGEAYLVEINTNASAYLLSCLAYRAHGHDQIPEDAITKLKVSFDEQVHLEAKKKPFFVVTDENILEQKMRLEFVLYQKLIQSWGYESEIIDIRDLTNERIELINKTHTCVVYNRTTDFYFETPDLQILAGLWTHQVTPLFPHPWAYGLSADKLRLSEFSTEKWKTLYQLSENEMKPLLDVIIPTFTPEQFGSIEKIWNERKTLFFKPRQAYGGKSVYRGQSISRKVFDRIMSENTLIQKFVQPQAWPDLDQKNFMENWKFDLRFYVYKGEIQLAIARSYQGQVTNFSSQYGGLTAINFVSN